MSDEESKELKRLSRRMAEFEAAADMRRMAPPNEDEQVLSEVCERCNVGVRSVQSDTTEAEIVLKRRVVARVLRKKQGWIVKRIAAVLRKTERAVYKML
jgi:hypothetical protein